MSRTLRQLLDETPPEKRHWLIRDILDMADNPRGALNCNTPASRVEEAARLAPEIRRGDWGPVE